MERREIAIYLEARRKLCSSLTFDAIGRERRYENEGRDASWSDGLPRLTKRRTTNFSFSRTITKERQVITPRISLRDAPGIGNRVRRNTRTVSRGIARIPCIPRSCITIANKRSSSPSPSRSCPPRPTYRFLEQASLSPGLGTFRRPLSPCFSRSHSSPPSRRPSSSPLASSTHVILFLCGTKTKYRE